MAKSDESYKVQTATPKNLAKAVKEPKVSLVSVVPNRFNVIWGTGRSDGECLDEETIFLINFKDKVKDWF